ncbi:probable peptidoglycan muropeptide transporter SLC46 isoform X2 [Eurosta solidaginis]|uniref:probable peptidoglycan muropeptide transporter SLC46 isoform X2 n=1 Tax=Eurosta solidaginis TaxID=178769 RepID=UPI003530DE8E
MPAIILSMATYQAALFMGLMTGSFTAGYLYEATNATFVFLTSCCCIFVATCIILCFVPESLNRRRFPLISNSSFISQTTNEMQPTGAQLTEFRKLFDLKAVKEMWNTCFKQRECNDRSIVWLAMIALLISVFVIDGSMMVFYLFIRAKFHWSIKEFTTYETTSTFVSTLGNVIGVIILRKIFKLSIVYLGILAFLSESVGYFTRAFADTNWLMYLSVGLSALKSMAQPMCRTIISNALPANELGTILRNQIIYQACTTVFNYNESICQELGTKNVSEQATKIETEVQPYVANLFMLRTLLESIVPALCGVFIGSWSDHYGRKPLLIISMIGFSFTYIIAAVICEIAIYQPVNPWYYVLAVVPHSILGGNCVFSVAAFCFISDVTDTKTRPYRMIFMEAFFFIGLMGGSLLSSFVYAATGATTTFMISGLLMCGATIFIIIYVPESLHYNRNQEILAATNIKEKQIENIPIDTLSKSVDGKEKRRSELVIDENGKVVEITMGLDGKISLEQENEANKNLSNCEKAKVPEKQKAGAIETGKSKKAGLFSYIHVKDMLVTCFKDRPYYDRSIIWLVTGTMFLSIFVLDGAMTVFYLFVREKFQWSVRDFTFYETVSHMVPMLGALIGFLILRKVFSMSVVTLALLAFFSDILSSIVRGVAYEPWHLYLAVGLGAFKSVGGPMCRTIVSNIVPATDLGKIFSIKNVLQSIAPFMAAPLYTVIYKESLKTFPGLFNIVSAALYSIAFIFLIIVLRFKYSYKEHYASILK